MGLLSDAASWVPAIRRLRNGRDSLLAERNLLLSQNSQDARDHPGDAEARSARLEGRLIITEYGYDPQCRPIETGAGGQRLQARFRGEEYRYRTTLRGVAKYVENLLRIPRFEEDPTGPFWANDWFPPLDGASLYGLIGAQAPRRYIEVGSGISTRFARRAIQDLGLNTKIISIDPHPHTVVDSLCDEVVRRRMEDVPRDFWNCVEPDDMLFVDNSHRSFPNSDVTVFFSEVLPALPPGTIWGLHDILLPWDYPEVWRQRFYNEQYLLLAYLLGGANGDEIILPSKWVSCQPRLHDILAPLWRREDLFREAGTHGGCFWMRRGPVTAS